jgi:hypothetical protein
MNQKIGHLVRLKSKLIRGRELNRRVVVLNLESEKGTQ